MLIKELKAGDHFTQDNHGQAIEFEVIAVKQIGRQYLVQFQSQLGQGSACYHGNAFLTETPPRRHAQH